MDGAGLVERDQVIDSVGRLIAGLAQGRGGALFVLGEAGLGKTSVLEYARGLAEGAGQDAGLGRGHPMETAVPFGLVAQALGELGLRIGAASPDRAAMFYRVLRWLEERPAGAALLVLDDLHWADADSLALASFICRRVASLPVALIGSMRPWPGEAADAALGLAHDGYASVQRLSALSAQGSAAVLASRLEKAVSAEVSERVFRLCAGNPLLLEQAARAIAHDAELPAGEGLLLSRFAGLPSPGMRCAQAAAVLGTRFPPAVAAQVAGLDREEATIALESLGRSGLVEQGSDADAGFVHPLFRQALYDDLPGPVRTRLHARAFTVLAERGMTARAAEHAIQANLVGDEHAIEVLTRAGTAARRSGALETAARQFDAAVALAGDRADADLLLAQGDALLASGNPARAITAYQHLLSASADLAGSVRVQAHWMLGRAFVLAGAHDKAAAAFDAAVELALPDDPGAAVAVLLDWSFSTWLSTGPGHALTTADRAAHLAATAGEDVRASADAAWGNVALQTGDPVGLAAAEAAARTAWSGRASGMGLAASLHPLANYGFCMVLIERFAEADRAFAEILAIAENTVAVQDITLMSNVHGWVLTRMGRLDDALATIDRAVSLADLVPVTEAYSWMARSYIQLYRGDLADSARWYDRAEPAALERGQWNSLLYLCDIRGVRSLRSGMAAEAAECYARLEDIMQKTGIGEPCLPPWARHGIAAYLAAGRAADAERVIGWLDECAKRLPCRFPRIAAATGRAWLAELAGDKPLADSLFQQALELHESVDMPLELAETLLGYGEFLRRCRSLSRAREVLAQAARVASAAGAEWLAGLATAELRLAGGRRRRAASGLTAAERRVAALVITGATNREIARQLYVSVSTIESHLERIYFKLGIRSRHELMALSVAGGLNIGEFPDKP